MSDQKPFSLSGEKNLPSKDSLILSAEDKKIDAFIFQINGRKFGIELPYVQEVCLLKQLTPVPAIPAFIKGLAQLRRKVLCVVDLSIFLDLPLHSHPLNQAYLLVLGHQNREFALLIDQAEGVQSLTLASDKEAHKGILQEFIAAAAQDDIFILDGEKLLQDARLLIRTY